LGKQENNHLATTFPLTTPSPVTAVKKYIPLAAFACVTDSFGGLHMAHVE